MKMRRVTAILVAKMISMVCRLSGREGVTLAGAAALKIDPQILSALALQVSEKILVVCGTNGKTTTNNILCTVIEEKGKKLVCNRTGSNMLQGIAAAFVLSAKWSGKLEADYACLEVDEASAAYIFPQIRPDLMILTNLFRDQLDRYGEIDLAMQLLERAMKMVPGMVIVVNADDPLAWYLAAVSGNPHRSFGIAEQVYKEKREHETRDGGFCKKCGSRLDYAFYHYGQMGKYRCPVCGFARPQADYEASVIRLDDGLEFEVEQQRIRTEYRGFYNIYNILAAYSAMRVAGLERAGLAEVFRSFRSQNGRMELMEIGGIKVILNLAKNPAGFNQNLEAVLADCEEKDLIIVINDNAADGRDISWLWDVDFERLSDAKVHSVTACGIRCLDLRLRLKYAERKAEAVPDVRAAAARHLKENRRKLYVLVNYTALYSTRKILLEMQKK